MSEEALALLLAGDYPGNVRELENAIEHAFVLCSSGYIEPRHLPAALARSGTAARSPGVAAAGATTLRDLERRAILDALRRHAGSRKAAARELGLARSTFFRKLKSFGIQRPGRGGRGGDGQEEDPGAAPARSAAGTT